MLQFKFIAFFSARNECICYINTGMSKLRSAKAFYPAREALFSIVKQMYSKKGIVYVSESGDDLFFGDYLIFGQDNALLTVSSHLQ